MVPFFTYHIPQFYSVFVCFKPQIVSRGAKIVFSQSCWDVNNEVSERTWHFCLCFFVSEDKEKRRKNKNNKCPEKWYFSVGWGQRIMWKLAFFSGKLQKHYLCSEGGKRAFLFWENVAFLLSYKIIKHYKDGFQRAQGKTANSPLL